MCNESKGLQNSLYMWFEYLCEVIDLLERATLPCAIDENKRALIPIANCSSRVHKRYMSPMELVLNTSKTMPLVSIPCYLSFSRSASDKEGNFVRPKHLQPLHRLEYMCQCLKESRYNLCKSQERLLTSYITLIATIMELAFQGLNRAFQSQLFT